MPKTILMTIVHPRPSALAQGEAERPKPAEDDGKLAPDPKPPEVADGEADGALPLIPRFPIWDMYRDNLEGVRDFFLPLQRCPGTQDMLHRLP